jgi:hypothetical protein
MKRLVTLLFPALLFSANLAAQSMGNYVPQSSFNIPLSNISGMDRDSVGNLYVMGTPPGSSAYQISSFSTPALSPLFSFNTGISSSSPLAFAVEASGVVDILDAASGFELRRFNNAGTLLGQAAFSLGYITPNLFSTAIDPSNQFVYIAYQYTYTPIYTQCLGCQGPSSITAAKVNQYDFQGNLLRSFLMPGTSSSACNTPTALAVDPQGNLSVADSVCQQLIKYSDTGSLLSQTAFPAWISARGMWTDLSSNIYISGTVCQASCIQGIAKLGSSGSIETTIPVNSAAGCAWDNRILYASSAGSSPIERLIDNDPPSVPAESSPIGLTVQHSSSAALSWQASQDPDGDSVMYTAYLGTSPNQLSSIGSTAQTGFNTQPLLFGVTYYWQVAAEDFYLGLPIQQSLSPIENFNLSLINNPPNPFSVISGTGTNLTRSHSTTLAWQPAQDPDGDEVIYDLDWGTSPNAETAIAVTTATSWDMTGLAFGTTYYWQVVAEDSYGASTQIAGGTQFYLPLFWNPQPNPVVYLSTASSYSLHMASPIITLNWSPSEDAASDPINYTLSIKTSTSSWPDIPMGQSTAITLGLQLETTYYWEVLAENPYGGVSTGTWQSFIIHLQNNPPAVPVYTSSQTITTRAASYALSWQSAQDPDGDAVGYELYLSSNPAAQYLIHQGTQTAYELNFQFGTTYYWRVEATDSFGATSTGTLESFLPIFDNPPIPTPIIYGSSGTWSEHAISPSAALSWSAVSDSYNDLINYRVYLGTSAELSLIQDSTSTTLNLTRLQFETTYYWQVEAYDAYGASSTSVVQNFFISLQNSAPGNFSVLSGTGTFETRLSSQTLSWTKAVDPDSDEVFYALSISTIPGFFPAPLISTATYYELNFQYGTTYYWSVSAADDFGGSSTISGSTQTFLPIFINQAPPPPNLVSPFVESPVVQTMANNVNISWEQVSDPQNDPITYTLYFGNSPSYMPAVAIIDSSIPNSASPLNLRPLGAAPEIQIDVAQDTSSIAVTLKNLAYYQNYYLQVAAQNPYNSTSKTAVQTFSLASSAGFPKAYNYPNPFSPYRGGTHIVFNAPASGYSQATVEIYSEWQTLLFKRDYFNIPPGISQQVFDGRDRYGRALFNGSYICEVRFSGPADKEIFYMMVAK